MARRMFNNNNIARVMLLAALALGSAGVPGLTAAQTCPNPPTPPEVVCNGGFESPSINGQAQTLPAGPGPSGFGWSIGGNSIDLVKNFWQAAEGSQSIDLDGNAPGSIKQTLTPCRAEATG